VAAAFERMHAAPGERLGLLERIKREYFRIRAENAAAEAAAGTEEGAVSEMRRVHAFAELNALVKALPPEIRGRISGALTLAKARTTELSLTDFLVKRIAMIDRELERALRNEYRGRIENLLERTKPKKTAAGVPVSTLGPEVQHSTDLARAAAELNGDQTSEQIDIMETALSQLELPAERQTDLLEQWAILNSFGDLKNRNAEELAKAHEWLSTLVRTGRSEWRQTQETRLQDVRAKRGEVIVGMGPATREGLNQQEMGQGAKAMLDSFGLSHSSFIQFLARILPRTVTFLKSWQDRVRRADNADQDFARDASTRLTERLRTVANTRGGMSRMMWQLKEVQPKAVKIGDEMVSMSRLEAIQYLLSWNQPDIQQKMRDNDGFTEESIAQMRAMTSDEASQTVMRFLREEYDRIYKAANPVYRRMFGMDMPENPLYAPARFEGGEVGSDMSPFGGPIATSGITPGALKARVNHTSKLRQMDAITVYWQHIAQMSHWIHFAELQRELRGVLTDKEVRRSIQQTHGKMTLQQLEKWIDALGRQGGNKANELLINQWFLDGLISAKAMAALGFNLRTIFAQLDSATRAIFAMPMGRIAKAMLDPRFISNISKAWHSDTIQRRVQGGASPEARYLFEQTRVKPSLMLRLGRASMAPVQFTDGVLTSLSSAIVYTDSYNQNKAAGMTDEQAAAAATDDMDDAVYRYSQPTGLGSRSLQELTGDRWKKAFMMFMSDPRLKAALYAEAAKNIMSGKGTKADARRILAVHAMALLSQIVINAYKDTFSDDDDEDIWTWQSLVQATLMGPIQGFILLGSAGEAVMSKLLQGRYFAPSRDPLLDVIGRGERAMTHWRDAFQTEDKKALIREWDNIFRAIAVHPVTAGPATIINFMKPIFGFYENIQKEED
jgi:hypothetical protein